MRTPRVIVVGAGVAGLVAAVDLARRGVAVTAIERAASPGGKLREQTVDGVCIDAGPTVFTMRRVFEQIFADAGTTLSDHLTLRPAGVLARHAWNQRDRLDLFADKQRSASAIGEFAGAAEARGYLAFCDRARAIFGTLEHSFIRSARPTPASLVGAAGIRGIGDLWRIAPFATLWKALGEHFKDPRLRQLFGRYATYSGSSPFLAPATLMLIAHVEQDGVWLVDGGMRRIADALEGLGRSLGVVYRYGTPVDEVVANDAEVSGVRLASGEFLAADAVVVNADAAALAIGKLGDAVSGAAPRPEPAGRSLSAITWAMHARTEGFPLLRHNVFFSGDYKAEFDALFRHARTPAEPTVYVCAQDRDDDGLPGAGPERLLCLINAPATGDTHPMNAAEIERCTERTFALMARCGLRMERDPAQMAVTTPAMFEQMFPATGGALYGQAVHGSMAAFRRPASRTRIAGLYLAGGSVHPGPGVPMAALSGRMAAANLLADFASTSRSHPVVTSGGISTRKAMTDATRSP